MNPDKEPYYITNNWNQNYICIHDWSKVDINPISFGDHELKIGDKIIKFGSKNRTGFEMKEGFYLEYKGIIDNWLIFDCNYSESNKPKIVHYYFAFIRVNAYVLLKQTKSGNGFADLRIDNVVFYSKN